MSSWARGLYGRRARRFWSRGRALSFLFQQLDLETHHATRFRIHHAPLGRSADAFEDAPGDSVVVDVAEGLGYGINAEAEFDDDARAVEALGSLAFGDGAVGCGVVAGEEVADVLEAA